MEINNLQSVILIPDDTAPSFCHYQSNDNGKMGLMSIDMLEKCIHFCTTNRLSATVLYGNRLSNEHLQALSTFAHTRLIAANEMNRYERLETDVIVVDYDGSPVFERFEERRKYHVVLRINMEDARHIPMTVHRYHALFSRLNVVVKNIADADENALNRFRLDIQPLKEVMYNLFWENRPFEINLATDRWALEQVKSCDAGVKHITIAPDGQFYICPAFYYDAERQSIGSPLDGINIPNAHLLRMDYAPLCKLCDAYQCRRCIYLNKKLTREYNTPSRRQCVVSHHERNLSGMLLQKLQNRGMLPGAKSIPPLYHTDPLDFYKDMDRQTGFEISI